LKRVAVIFLIADDCEIYVNVFKLEKMHSVKLNFLFRFFMKFIYDYVEEVYNEVKSSKKIIRNISILGPMKALDVQI